MNPMHCVAVLIQCARCRVSARLTLLLRSKFSLLRSSCKRKYNIRAAHSDAYRKRYKLIYLSPLPRPCLAGALSSIKFILSRRARREIGWLAGWRAPLSRPKNNRWINDTTNWIFDEEDTDKPMLCGNLTGARHCPAGNIFICFISRLRSHFQQISVCGCVSALGLREPATAAKLIPTAEK